MDSRMNVKTLPPVAPEPIPIVVDSHGVARVGGTRVTLDSIIASFQLGNTPETIAEQYDTVSLSDIYAVITFYLRHQDVVDAYVAETEATGDQLRAASLADPRTANLRTRLLARRQA